MGSIPPDKNITLGNFGLSSTSDLKSEFTTSSSSFIKVSVPLKDTMTTSGLPITIHNFIRLQLMKSAYNNITDVLLSFKEPFNDHNNSTKILNHRYVANEPILKDLRAPNQYSTHKFDLSLLKYLHETHNQFKVLKLKTPVGLHWSFGEDIKLHNKLGES